MHYTFLVKLVGMACQQMAENEAGLDRLVHGHSFDFGECCQVPDDEHLVAGGAERVAVAAVRGGEVDELDWGDRAEVAVQAGY